MLFLVLMYLWKGRSALHGQGLKRQGSKRTKRCLKRLQLMHPIQNIRNVFVFALVVRELQGVQFSQGPRLLG
ncbi:hypothetical protein EDD21DRAFT_372384 [Dissophora ornata]|nr:hypothetical protein EDD21DRAFT_372384 [Dissophora ornata]